MFSYIILHYKSIDETLKCLQCLKKINKSDSHFIVIDNNSLSIKEKEKIRFFTNDIIELEDNLGFAKANNIGVKYAKEKYKSKFYVVINNDVFIFQNDFENIIIENYKKYKFDMLGPKISSPSGESVNPFRCIKNKNELEKEIVRCKQLIKIYSNFMTYYLLQLYIKIKHLVIKPEVISNGEQLLFNVGLHGCAIIFSAQYVDKYQDVFINDTFLYHEEEFLYHRVLKDSLISVYDPHLEVFHKEGSSVKKKNKKKRLSKLFREKNRLESLYLLRKYIEK